MAVNERIFRQYDIRGIFGEDLTVQDAALLGRAFGTFLRQKGESKAIVGRDNRESSPVLHEHLVKGLLETGVDVIDIGVVISPIFYYATHLYGINAGIMITASHNPAKYNGFKVQYGGRTLYGEELQQLKAMANRGVFEKGSGRLTCRWPADDYISMMKEKIVLGDRKLKVVVDCGNGTAGLFAPAVMRELGCDVIPLYCESDPTFPNHFPDPVKTENLKDLITAVKENKADLGIGFDGDGDRLGVVDEQGNILWGDMLMILFWREILPKYPGADAIVEVKCSDLLVNEIRRLGGKPFFYKTGHSLIKAKMKEINAVFTGEMSGHMFFADEYYGYDDALYAAARLLRILSHSDKPLSELLSDVPKTYCTPEIRVACEEDKKHQYVSHAKKYFKDKGYPFIDVDGVRVQFANGWGLVRASNTGPELIIRCEAGSQDQLETIKQEIARSISPLKVA
ncbi:phosphoglucomutase/phosphomannomutase alpha/beta/alpha domain II [Desulfotomaculum nigrificans CO-1-SRB]|uniref:Phosphoglucomutase/phosphomannomutase alpha/beta/alpha domain II n=1 Tax=Desulfotomaculum nigrificans (strain DSM 14880 / VKM B-2319 / CO-1-SRB) TaxID=868595 RepID=F6BA29_DESCC|nr:phosphomannomutase/phosphoglucomutase [Desulfotomaculum nigrificans]AEF94998.1 phosphoglucomutase/phosphomannomutase alpha/beta/alpha domain II [Desulfotomaculum nigrificans CO-1-SRB]